MASLVQGSYEDAKALPENNKTNRIAKMRALSEFIPQNAVDQDGDAFHGSGGIFENFNGYNTVVQKQIIKDAIAIIDAAQQQQQGVYQPQSPTYSPTTPSSMSRGASDDMELDDDEEGLHINIPPPSSSRRNRNVSTKEDDSGRRSPDIVLEEAAQNHALTIPVDPNVFLPYQRRVIEAIRQIEQMRPNDLPAAHAADLRRIIIVVYEIFFGVDYRTGAPTAFYQQHGAAPIAGMDPAQLTQQATHARQAQAAVAQNAEDSLGFLRTFLQPLFQRANDPAVATAFTASWQQQGANTNIAAPFNDIRRLMTAVQSIHEAGAHLVRSDPLFITNRSERVQQGDLRVRNWYERIGYWIALNGYASFRDMVSSFGPPGANLATRMDDVMPAAYRSSHLAIEQFEAALNGYNTIYQGLPLWARLCWTLPYPPGSIEYNQAVARFVNKPGSEELQHAMALAQGGDMAGALQIRNHARGDVLNHPASTYPAFLTLTPGGQVNGPLIAYYYALHGGRMLYEQEGRGWLTDAFNSNPGCFIQELGQLTDTLEVMHTQYQASGGSLGAGFFGKNQAWLHASQVLESRNPQTRQQAAACVSQAFGTGQVGTISSGGTVRMCKPGGGGSSSMCESMRGTMRRTFNPQQSTQQGFNARPLYGNQVLEASKSSSIHAFRGHVADQQSKEVGAKYAQEERERGGEQVTTRFLAGLREQYARGNRGDQSWTTDTRQSTNNPEETITTPGVLEILNIHVRLYGPVPPPSGRPVSPRQQPWAEVPRDQAGVGRGPTLRLWQLLVRNLNGFRNIDDPDELLHRLGQVGTGIVWAARQGTGLDGFNNPVFRMRADEVRNIALQMLQNPLLRSIIHVDPDAQSGSTYTQNSARRAIHIINAQGEKKRGGRRTRKHKKRRKKTRRHRHHRKKTRHKKKKRTRKH